MRIVAAFPLPCELHLQVDLLETVKTSLFHTVCRLLFGPAFVAAHGSKALRAAFFDFEEAFELAASPLPHLLQPKFCRARRTLLTAFRCAGPPCVVGSLTAHRSTVLQCAAHDAFDMWQCSQQASEQELVVFCVKLVSPGSPVLRCHTPARNGTLGGPWKPRLAASAAGRQSQRGTSRARSWGSCWQNATLQTPRRRTCCWRCCGPPWCVTKQYSISTTSSEVSCCGTCRMCCWRCCGPPGWAN